MRIILTPLSPSTILAALSAEILLHNSLLEDNKIDRDQFNKFVEYAKVVLRIAECPRPLYGLTSRAVLAGLDAVGSIDQYMADIDAINNANPDPRWYAARREEAEAGLSDNPHLWQQNSPLAAAMINAAETAAADTVIDGHPATIHPALRHSAWVPGWHESLEQLNRYCCDNIGGGMPIHSMNMLWAWIENLGFLRASYGPRTAHEAEVDARWGDIRAVNILGDNAPHLDMAGGPQ